MNQKKPTTRAGASAGDGREGSPQEGGQQDLRDLFLSEGQLIRLAMGHLKGRRPPMGRPRPRAVRGDGVQSALKRRQLADQLKRELAARCWTPAELSEATELSVAECRALVAGAGSFTEDVAHALSRALATSVDLWMTGGSGED